MDVQASAPTHNIRYIAEEDRFLLPIDVLPDRKFAMSLTRLRGGPCRLRPSHARSRALSRAPTWTARAVALVTLASMLAACHTTRVVWARPGGDNTALQDDMQACSYHPPTATAYQPAPAQPAYAPTQAPFGYQPTPAPSRYSANPMAPAYSSAGATKSVTIDVQDEQRSPVNCMIAHGWRLTPLP